MKLLLVFLLCIAAAVPAWGGAWTSGVVLSTGGEGWQSASAIDASGNSIAVWDERTTRGLVVDRVWSRSRPAGGSWVPAAIVSPKNGSLQTTYVFPAVHISAAGFATAVWSDVGGVWTADRTAAGVWTAPQLLVAGISQPYFVMNSPGDMALVWIQGAGPRGTPNTILALRRPAGGAWAPAPETVISAPHVSANHVTLGDNGDALISWETYDASCSSEKCTLSNFVLHASRETSPGASWQDSGALSAADNFSHLGFVAVDAAGHGAVISGQTTTSFVALTQPGAGQPWSASAPVYTGVNPYSVGFGVDAAGNATFVLQELTAATIVAVGGNIQSNHWTAPVVISAKDQSPNQVIFGIGAGGTAVVIWAAGNPNYSNNVIRVAVHASRDASWSAPLTLAKTSLGGPESVAVGSGGQAVVTYASFSATLTHTEFAANYKP